jgi:hypothetical protein
METALARMATAHVPMATLQDQTATAQDRTEPVVAQAVVIAVLAVPAVGEVKIAIGIINPTLALPIW